MGHGDIAQEILAMAQRDQQMRKDWETGARAWDRQIDVRNTSRMKEIIEAIGWPGASKVGAEASVAAWLLVQHADRDPAFQRACLERMKQESAGEVSLQHLAMLEDRVAVREGRPQRYGTQFHPDQDGNNVPHPIEDEQELDERRAAMGLPPFSEYRQRMEEIGRRLRNRY